MYEVRMRPAFCRGVVVSQAQRNGWQPRPPRLAPLALLFSFSACAFLSGCGGVTFRPDSAPSNPDPATLVATPSSVDFGAVTLGNSVNVKVSFENTGSAAIRIRQLASSDDAFQVDGKGKLPVSLAAGSSLSFNVRFAPVNSDDLNGHLDVITDESSSPSLTVKLHGKGSASAHAVELNGLNCDQAQVTGAATDTCTVDTNIPAPSGGVMIQLSSNSPAIKVPASVTVPEGSSSAKFSASIAKVTSGQTGIITATQGRVAKSVSISLAPPSTAVELPVLSALSCTSNSFAAAGTTTCKVSLSAAPTSALNVALATNSSAVSVPASVIIPSGSTTVSFTAHVAAVSTSQTVTVTAAANASSKSVALQLKASNTTAPALTLSTSNLNFGNIAVGTAASKSVTVISTGTSAVTIKSGSIAGTGFSVSGASLPATLKSGQSLTLSVQFKPSTSGPATGQLTISSNAGTAAVSLSGTGAASQSAPKISAVACSNNSVTGSLSDQCTIALSGPAPNGGLAIAVSSSSSAVSVPANITVPAGSASASFVANITAVTVSQTVTISATSNGSTGSVTLQLKPSTAALTLSTSSLAFGSVSVGTSVSKSLTLTASGTASVTIRSAAVSGTGFSVSGLTLPATLKPGEQAVLTIRFNPAAAGSVTGQLVLSSSAVASTVSLSGTGTTNLPTLSSLSCASTSITGSLADSCKVTLSASAPTGGISVSLASSSVNVVVPSSVMVPGASSSAAFTAKAAAVSTAQSIQLTATSGGTSKSVSLQLNPALAQLSANATSISFGAVVVGHATTQVVTLTSSGAAAVTIKSISVTGTGFSLSSVSLPATLNPGQTLSITLTFDPTTTGSLTGKLSITSDSSAAATLTIPLSGTSNPHQVVLSWNAPSGASIPNYKVYRAGAGTNSFAKLSTVGATTYTDTTVQSGQNYSYYVTSVNSSGVESTPSNTTTVKIP